MIRGVVETLHERIYRAIRIAMEKAKQYSKRRELDSKSIKDQVKFNHMQTTKAELKTRHFVAGKKVQAYLHATVSRIIVTSFTALFHSTAKDTH